MIALAERSGSYREGVCPVGKFARSALLAKKRAN